MSGSHSGAYGIRRCKAGDQQASTRNKTIIKDKHPSLIYLESRGRSRPRLLPSSGLLLIECCRVDAGFNGRRIIFSKLSYILLMAGGKDKGAGESKVKDPVSQMRIQRQGLHKEAINQRINDNFQINRPSNINFYSEKPNNNPYLLMKMKEEGKTINGVDYEEKLRDGHYKTELTSEINDKLKTVTHTPKDKWNTPQTSNQEIGWLANQRFDQHSKFVHKREGCPETHYVDSYITMRHVSLFSNKSKKG